MNTTHLMVSSPRGTRTHLSRHGELTLCGRQIPATWLQEPCTAERTVSCTSCAVTGGLPAPAGQPVAVQLEDEELAMPERRDDAGTLLVVPCSGVKLDTPAPAGQLYRGTLATMGLAACAVIVRDPEDPNPRAGHVGARTMILSALHGLIDPDRVLEPYDVRMGDVASITTAQLADQLRATGARRVVAFTPSAYTQALQAACDLAGLELVAAFAGLRGIGEQRGLLAALRRSGGYGPQHRALLRLESAVMAAAHAEALQEDANRRDPAMRALLAAGFTPARAQEVLDVRNRLGRELAAIAERRAAEHAAAVPTPSASCSTDSGRHAAMRQNAQLARDRLNAAMRTLPAAGTPALC